MPYKEFIFEHYSYDPVVSTLSLRYRFGSGPKFEEKLVFDFMPRKLSLEASKVLDRIFRMIFLMSGVSYYKSFVPRTLICECFSVDRITAQFLQKFYEKGLAEFAFRNRISLRGHFAIRQLEREYGSNVVRRLYNEHALRLNHARHRWSKGRFRADHSES